MAESWAVKYRPKTWSDITGNETAAKVLASAVKTGQIPPAIFLTGTRGSGKCFWKDEYVLTPKGIMKGKDLAPDNAFGHTGYFRTEVPLINMDGQQEVSTEFFNNGNQNCCEITTKSGRCVHVTMNHPLYEYILPNKGTFTAAQDLREGSRIALLSNTRCFGSYSDIDVPECFQMQTPKTMTEDFAFFIGLHTALTVLNWLAPNTCSEKEQFSFYKKYKKELFPDYQRFASNLQFENFMHFMGAGSVFSDTLEVPHTILQSPENMQAAFMSGLVLFTGGYSVVKESWSINLKDAANLVRGLQFMLLNVGVNAAVRKNTKHEWILEVTDPQSLYNLSKFIGPDFPGLIYEPDRHYIDNSKRPGNSPVYIPDEIVKIDYQTRTLPTIDFHMPFSHSFILNGIVSHNTTSARLYARSMFCDNLKEDGSPCNECESCKDFLAGRYEDYSEIDAASNNSAEGIRALTKSLSFMPVRGKYRIVLLDECHALSNASSNALLKTLEEPPEHVKFIFCTTDPQKVLDTIKSRTLIFNFTDIKANDIIRRLKYIAEQEHAAVDELALTAIAQYANGGMRDAVMMLNQACLMKASSNEPVTSKDILEIAGYLSVNESAVILKAMLDGLLHAEPVENILQKFTPQAIIKSCISLLENILLIKQGVPAASLVPDDKMHVVLSVASQMSTEDVYTLFDVLQDSAKTIKEMSFVPVTTLFNMKLAEAAHRIAQIRNAQQSQQAGTNTSQSGHRALLLKLKEEFGMYPVVNAL